MAASAHPEAKRRYEDARIDLLAHGIVRSEQDLDAPWNRLDGTLASIESGDGKVRLLRGVIEANKRLANQDKKRRKLVEYCCDTLDELLDSEGLPGAQVELGARVMLLGAALLEDRALGWKHLAAFDKMIRDNRYNEEWVLAAKVSIGRELQYRSSFRDPEGFRPEVLNRLHEVVDTHPGTSQAGQALLMLVGHYLQVEPEPAKAKAFALRILEDNPEGNATHYVAAVNLLVHRDASLFRLIDPEALPEAVRVIRRYPKLSSSAKRTFIRNVDNTRYFDAEVEETLSKVIGYAKDRGNSDLLRGALLLQGQSYFRKRQFVTALDWYDTIRTGYAGVLSPEDQLAIMDYSALSHLLRNHLQAARELYEQLEAQAPEPADAPEGVFRTKPYYMYLRAATLFEAGEYALSTAAFEKVASAYPGTPPAKRSTEYLEYLAPLSEALSLTKSQN